ncbi:MAG TPA: hypothetical protein VFM25_13170 [Verrucomicrobiae bacterium]|nr:hypothetical protein [Verrucomicrobiae bacterium]
MNVSLGELEIWVKEQVERGDFADSSELLREAVRRMKLDMKEPAALQDAMDEAEISGFKSFAAEDWQALRQLARTGERR